MENTEKRKWKLCQDTDFASFRPPNWRTKLDGIEESPRIYFHHRLGDRYRPTAVGDKKLKFWLRNENYKSPKSFNKNFAQIFNSDKQIPNLLSAEITRTGNRRNVLEATYDINVDSYSDFFEAYIAALSLAIDEHIISNPGLINRIDKLYTEAVEESRPF
jgi:hypothetical protein